MKSRVEIRVHTKDRKYIPLYIHEAEGQLPCVHTNQVKTLAIFTIYDTAVITTIIVIDGIAQIDFDQHFNSLYLQAEQNDKPYELMPGLSKSEIVWRQDAIKV